MPVCTTCRRACICLLFQPNVTVVTKSSDASPSPEMPPSQNLDSFGREMEDLQKLLVSMATGN